MKMLPLSAAAIMIGLAGPTPAYPERALVPCAYPHGWNSTDAALELRGVPKDRDHMCVVEYDRYYRPHPGWGWRYYYY